MRVYQSLVRPRLSGGAEWRLTFLNVMLCLILIFGGGLKWWTLVLAAFLATGGQWMLRRAAKRDPEWTSVYMRHLLEPPLREPHGLARSRPERLKPVLPKHARWWS